jgi:uncharacterized protein YbaA (DUF1428 family)
MAKYVDGFVLVVPKDKVEEYTKMANEGRDVWMRMASSGWMIEKVIRRQGLQKKNG